MLAENYPTGDGSAPRAPFLLWLLQRTKLQSDLKNRSEHVEHYKLVDTRKVLATMSLYSLLFVLLLLRLVKTSSGGVLNSTHRYSICVYRAYWLRYWQGIGLAFAGTIIQRISNNLMASPILGISSGAALALVLGTLFGTAVGREEQMLLGTLGATSVTALVWLMGRKHNFAPTQTLLTGIALVQGSVLCCALR